MTKPIQPIKTAPANPVSRNYIPRGGTPYPVKTDDDLASIAKANGLSEAQLTYFNFKTTNPAEINWYLQRNVGCTKSTRDGKNYMFSSDDHPGIIYIPKSAVQVGNVVLNLNGLSHLNKKTAEVVITTVRQGFEPVVAKAKFNLIITKKEADLPPENERRKNWHKNWLWLEVRFDEDEKAVDPCAMAVGECGTGSVWIVRHRQLAICGKDPKTRTMPFLTTDDLLGRALGNAALHELGHKIGHLDDNRISGNPMSTLGPLGVHTAETLRSYWAGKQSWDNDQERILVDNLKNRRLADDIEIAP